MTAATTEPAGSPPVAVAADQPLRTAAPPLLFTAVRFGAVGLMGVAVNEGVLAALHLGLGVGVTAAAVVATQVAIVANYLGNERFTFGLRPAWARLARFELTALGGAAITVLALRALMALTPLDVLLANLAAIAAGTVWNFVVNVGWTWRNAS